MANILQGLQAKEQRKLVADRALNLLGTFYVIFFVVLLAIFIAKHDSGGGIFLVSPWIFGVILGPLPVAGAIATIYYTLAVWNIEPDDD